MTRGLSAQAASARAIACCTLAVSTLFAFASCAGSGNTPAPRQRALLAQARAGETAYLTGRASEAVAPLREAVRLQLATGDLPGAARGLVNLALAQRAAGDPTGAAATAGRLRELTPAAQQQAGAGNRAGNSASAELTAGTAWLDALLALDQGDAPGASRSLFVVPSKLPAASPWPGRVETLRAAIALAEGRAADAVVHARAAQAACAAAQDRAEEARALRLAGQAHVQLAQWMDARARFLSAVRIEETLGAGERMAGDLDQLAAIATKMGETAAADLYAQRARAIAAAR
jgi:hypothetical protein